MKNYDQEARRFPFLSYFGDGLTIILVVSLVKHSTHDHDIGWFVGYRICDKNPSSEIFPMSKIRPIYDW